MSTGVAVRSGSTDFFCFTGVSSGTALLGRESFSADDGSEDERAITEGGRAAAEGGRAAAEGGREAGRLSLVVGSMEDVRGRPNLMVIFGTIGGAAGFGFSSARSSESRRS